MHTYIYTLHTYITYIRVYKHVNKDISIASGSLSAMAKAHIRSKWDAGFLVVKGVLCYDVFHFI